MLAVSWYSVVKRCLAGGKHQADRPSYVGCVNGFGSFQEFGDWAISQIGYRGVEANGKRWQLDKELLLKGNKTYCKEVCVFLPSEVNGFLINRKASRGDYPVGVCLPTGRTRFRASCGFRGRSEQLGTFGTAEEAFSAYKAAKESYAKELAAKWQSQIDPRAYDALMNYTVDITD